MNKDDIFTTLFFVGGVFLFGNLGDIICYNTTTELVFFGVILCAVCSFLASKVYISKLR